MFIQEMGFSLIVEAMINNLKKKPLIGHNLIYDILYFYNQFIDKLPDTYMEFISIWNKLFSITYDNKILAYKNSDIFTKNVLGDIFELC